jgi:two-component system sensor histidine kinase BaeS
LIQLRSLWFKLTAALVIVTLLGVGMSLVIPQVMTTRNFETFVQTSRATEREAMVEALTVYYQDRGNWEGLELLLVSGSGHPDYGMGPGGPGGMWRAWPFRLADANGVVIASQRDEEIGQQLTAAELSESIAIEVNGQRVGYLVSGFTAPALRQPEQDFLARMRESIVPVGAAACGVAILLGLVLTWQMTGPLRKLTTAAQGIAGGDLSQRVDIKSKDEIGELGRAFNEMAESLSRAETLRQNMTADIAHELRTPLSVIRANLEAILDGVFDPDTENVESIHKETVLLSRLVDDLQELALAEAGQLRIEPEPTDLADLAERVVTGVVARAEGEGVTLVKDLAPDLPLVSVDSQRISQVLSNLIDNALRHSSEGTKVTVRARQAGQMVQVDVVDEGPGLSPEELSLVFERFYRGDKARSRRTGGAGLGLSIVRQLVEAHGGRVWVESTEGQGATFSFALPVGTPDTT